MHIFKRSLSRKFIEGFIKYLDGQISYLKDMETHYNKRRRVLENSISKCKESMVRALDLTDNNKIKTFNYNFSLCESESWKLNEDDLEDTIKEELIDKGLAKLIFKPSMSEIKSEYKELSDEKRPKWLLVEKKKYVNNIRLHYTLLLHVWGIILPYFLLKK